MRTIPVFLALCAMPFVSYAQLRAYTTYADYQNDKPSLVRDGVHMNGAFKGEGEMEKFVDEDDKAIGMDPDKYWGFVYDTLVFRCLPDQQIKYGAVLQFGEHLFMYYRGAADLRIMANSEAYGKRGPVFTRGDMHGLLEIPVAFSAGLGTQAVLWNASKGDFIDALGKHYKEDAIVEFKKAFFRAGSDKARFEAIQALLKGAKS